MPVFIECSACHRKLRVRTELLGKSVRCPNCRAKFVATKVEGSAPQTSTPAEGPSAVLTPSLAVESEANSSGPTVRRQVTDLPPETTTPEHPPRQAIVAGPPSRPAKPEPALGPQQISPSSRETPWSMVSLVLGLILLGLIVLGLLMAWWINGGIQMAKSKQASHMIVGPGAAQCRPGHSRCQFSLKSNFCTVSFDRGLAMNFLWHSEHRS